MTLALNTNHLWSQTARRMRRLAMLLVFFSFDTNAQEPGFPFGQVTYRDLQMTSYDKDTTAVAVVLDEFGDAFMDDQDPYNLVFTVHRRIKILKPDGLSYANVEILLNKYEGKEESAGSIKASSFTLTDGVIKESPVAPNDIYSEALDNETNVKKFAIPNARVGSVIEYQYTLQTPFKYKFRSWYFQWSIPKVRSAYWGRIPANYVYNITLKGFLQLTTNESRRIRDCFRPPNGSADCVAFKFGMRDIPAFVEEEYMTARSNFISSINFELSAIHYFDGRVDKVTKEWKDAEQELRLHADFGVQLKRNSNDLIAAVKAAVGQEPDSLSRAKKVYSFVNEWYQWNGLNGMLAQQGIKKAFESRQGNVADINLSLIAALDAADVDVEPLILSTVSNGLPTDLHPVLSDFNYVVAKINIGPKVYLADATDMLLPFGWLPERCLNGKGRVLAREGSYWYELSPADRGRMVSVFTLKLQPNGIAKGEVRTTYSGYEAINQRRKIYAFDGVEEYGSDLRSKTNAFSVGSVEVENLEDISKPLVQKLEIELEVFNGEGADNFLFNPLLMKKWTSNPFRSEQRLYPVDFIRPTEFRTILTLEYPDGFQIANLPDKAGLALPNSGGYYVYEAKNLGNTLSVNSLLALNKTVFTSVEYHYLRELFHQMIQIQNSDLLFKKKI